MSILASCGNNVKLHGWPEGKYLGSYDPGDESLCVRTISWCNNGTKLVAVPSKGEPIIIETPQFLENNETIKLSVNYLNVTNANTATFSKTKVNAMTIGTLNGEVCVFDINTGKILIDYPVLPHGVQFLQYAADDTFLAAGCRNGQIILYTKRNKICMITASFVVHNSYSLSAMNCNSGYQYLLAGASKEGTVSVWDVNSANAILIGKNHTNIVTDLAFSPADRIISSVGLDRKFNTYDLRNAQLIFSNVLERELSSVAYALERDEMAVSTNDGQLLCFDKRNTNVPLCTFIAHKKPIKKVAFHSENVKPLDLETELAKGEQEYPASGDCYTSTDNPKKCNAEQQMNTTVNTWIENLQPTTSQTNFTADSVNSEELSDKNLEKLRNDLLKHLKATTDKFSEYMNQQFFKIRMEVSKNFVTLEDQTEKKSKRFLMALKEATAKKNVANRTNKASKSQSLTSKK